ncbi:MAG TPA: class I SAM-dependent methyltransferase [Bryobacteraceae bacterium]|nr:class I SAM-dependent methyltransferase [Bryobacteraceae bacterium]
MEPRFDQLASSYEQLLRDPIRDRFSGRESLFFHTRKRDLIHRFFQRRRMATAGLRYLDVGCGRGELLDLLRLDFGYVAGCDVSADMMHEISGIETRVQRDPAAIPFSDANFDFVTAVCVYHHVPPNARAALTAEIVRVVRPGGIFCMIEHNPLNPITRLIVSRTPIDADAVLLRAKEAEARVAAAGLRRIRLEYFLYFPQVAYRYLGGLESLLAGVPVGGQYALFGERKNPAATGPAKSH